MNNRTALALAAAFAVAGIGSAVAQNQSSQPMQQSQQSAQSQQNLPPLKLPPGVTQSQGSGEKHDVAEQISELVNQATTPDFEDMVDRLVDQDRDRIGEHKNMSDAQFKQAVQQFRQSWKQKYGQDFDMKSPDQIFSNAQIVTGEIKDAKQVVSHWPVNVTPGQQQAMPAAAQQGLTEETKDQGNISDGRNVAIFRLPGDQSAKLSAMDISLIHEAGGWKVDIPNNITGQQVHDGVVAQINRLNQQSSQWPSDSNKAKEMVAHCVLMGVYNVSQTQSQAQ